MKFIMTSIKDCFKSVINWTTDKKDDSQDQ